MQLQRYCARVNELDRERATEKRRTGILRLSTTVSPVLM
jgi:hypothetical protein